MTYKKSPIADLPASVSCRKVQNSAGVTYWRVRVGKKFTGGSVLEKNFASLGKAKEWIFGDIQRLKAQPGSLLELKASAGAAAFILTPAQITKAVDVYRRLAETPMGLTEAVDFAIRHGWPAAGTLCINEAIEAAKKSKKSNRKAYLDDVTRRWRRFAKWLPAEKCKRKRRIIPLEPNLITWLTPYRPASGEGKIVQNFRWKFQAFAKAANYSPWPKDCLRHSYASK